MSPTTHMLFKTELEKSTSLSTQNKLDIEGQISRLYKSVYKLWKSYVHLN